MGSNGRFKTAAAEVDVPSLRPGPGTHRPAFAEAVRIAVETYRREIRTETAAHFPHERTRCAGSDARRKTVCFLLRCRVFHNAHDQAVRQLRCSGDLLSGTLYRFFLFAFCFFTKIVSHSNFPKRFQPLCCNFPLNHFIRNNQVPLMITSFFSVQAYFLSKSEAIFCRAFEYFGKASGQSLLCVF